MENWIIAENIVAVAAISTAITIIIISFIKTSKFLKKVVHFFDDYFGEEERPGIERRPGFSERIHSIESCMTKVDERLNLMEYKIENIDKELRPNSGTSLRDAINRIDNRVEKLESGVDVNE